MTALAVRLEAEEKPIGHLSSADDLSTSFTYDVGYLASQRAHPISLSLPLQEEPFGDVATRAFFQNLLPENNQLDQIIEREGLDRADIVGLLAYVGADLSGALSCLPPDAPPAKSPGRLNAHYVALDQPQLEEVVLRLGAHLSLPDEVRDPSPVAGYQRKLALVALDEGVFAVPRAGTGAPTTHILKVPQTSLPREAFYEANCAQLAAFLGLDVAPSRSLWIAGHEVLLATRFDRVVAHGLVHRLHQEDFAQALSLPPRLKYERDGRPGRVFDAIAIATLLRRTAAPAEAVDAFLRSTFFNLAIGNTDNHAKNHALLYDMGPVPRLAPLYDLVPIRLSDRHHHNFSFSIGEADYFERLATDDLTHLFDRFGFSRTAASRFVRDRIIPILGPLARDKPVRDEWGARLDRLIVESSTRLLGLLEPLVTAPEG